MTDPAFTVIMATWNRGRHILPSIRSVLDQDLSDFELLVIGDATEDDTEVHVASLGDGRVRWANLSARAGTQSGPNNLGLDMARAPLVAYLGHDDIWAPDHLSALAAAYEAQPEAGAVCSGIVLYTQDPHNPYRVEGLFDGVQAFGPHVFTPPSAFSHRLIRVGSPRWKLRHETDVSVDYRFQEELAGQGCRFASTARITVHKIPASQRHLAYVTADSAAQEALLEQSRAPGFAARLDEITETARATGWYLRRQPDGPPVRIDPGRSDRIRGITVPECRAVGAGIRIVQDDGPRGLDWRPAAAEEAGWRWGGPNPTPKLRLAATARGPVRLAIDLLALADHGFPDLACRLNGMPVTHVLTPVSRMRRFLFARLILEGRLRPDGPSILEFAMPPERTGKRMDSVAVGMIEITPLQQTEPAPR